MTSSVEFPDDDNGDVLRRMQDGGDDFTKPRDIDFSVVFPSESSASEFADHVRLTGLKVAIQESDAELELPWDVTVTRYMLPTHVGITEFEETLGEAAASLEERNDGWGCVRQSIQH
jgi:hypothetical protein